MNAIFAVLFFLYSVVFGILCYSLLIRIGLYWFKVSSLHPVSQLISTLTNPLVNLTKKIVNLEKDRPSLPYNVIITLVAVVTLKYLIADLLFSTGIPISYLVIVIIADLIILPLKLLFFAVLVRAIMSWVRPDWHHPMNDVLILFTEPALKLGRYILPNVSGFDFSPLLIIVVLQMLILFISASLPIRLL